MEEVEELAQHLLVLHAATVEEALDGVTVDGLRLFAAPHLEHAETGLRHNTIAVAVFKSTIGKLGCVEDAAHDGGHARAEEGMALYARSIKVEPFCNVAGESNTLNQSVEWTCTVCL